VVAAATVMPPAKVIEAVLVVELLLKRVAPRRRKDQGGINRLGAAHGGSALDAAGTAQKQGIADGAANRKPGRGGVEGDVLDVQVAAIDRD